jgi:hypothetical protein
LSVAGVAALTLLILSACLRRQFETRTTCTGFEINVVTIVDGSEDVVDVGE